MTRIVPTTFLLILFASCASFITVPPLYDGELNKNGKYHGLGVLTYPNGDQYVGEFNNGLLYGKGTMTYPNGEKFVGEYVYGKRHGEGTMTFPSGEIYIGDYRNDVRHGIGGHVAADGTKYVGEWKNDKYDGQGTYTWSNGQTYIGGFTKGSRDGFGISTREDGGKYVGESNGMYNGKGVLFHPDGDIEAGIWDKVHVGNYYDPMALIEQWTIEAVGNYLKKTYPQFEGFDYEPPEKIVSKKPERSVFIAVVDLRGNNVPDDDCRALTDRLRAELFDTKYYKVIERAMMEEIMKEQGFQQSGCTTNECMVEVGKLIGVEQIVGGSISKVGSTYSVSARMVKVETGGISTSATYDFRGEIDGLLTKGMKQVAIKLANASSPSQ